MEQLVQPNLRSLFFSFLRLGATAFGGPAMVAYIREMAVDQHRWLTNEKAKVGAALCQMVPGATAMQMAAFVGFKARGVRGAAVTFIGFGLPAFLLMTLLALLYVRYATLPVAVTILAGLQAIVIAIVANSAVSFGRNALHDWRDILFALLSVPLFLLKIHPILVIAAAALIGWMVFRARVKTMTGAESETSSTWKQILSIAIVACSALTLLYFVDRELFNLATLMIRIDLFAFGGGYASLPLMLHEIVTLRGWVTERVFMDGIALGQVTPGPIVITATFIGYVIRDFAGALIATIAVFLPSFLMVVGLTPVIDALRRSRIMQSALHGILCSFVGMLTAVTIRFAYETAWTPALAVLCGAALAALLRKFPIYWIVLAGVVFSIVLL